MSDSISVIREFLISNSSQSIDATELDRSRDLLEEGVIDSLGLMELVEFIRERYALEFEPNEITAENFKTLGTIAALIDAKRQPDG
jgi:acyl carrier protein